MCYHPMIRKDGQMWMSAEKYVDGSQKMQEILNFHLAAGDWQLIACGQCIQCRCQYAEAWAARCTNEIKYHTNNHYVTLTYSDEEIPVMDIETGEIYRGLRNPNDYDYNGLKSREKTRLYHKDVQDFMKRLRRWAEYHHMDEETPMKYYMCGEYGSKNHRPHYHALIYGINIPDLKVNFRKNGYEYDKSETLDRLWGHGIVTIGEVTYNSARYVARYMMKKAKGYTPNGKKWADIYAEWGLPVEYTCMSRRPGIGTEYWKEHRKEIYKYDEIVLPNGKTVKPPKYYDQLEDAYLAATNELADTYDIEEMHEKFKSPEMQEISRERRRKANDRLFAELKQTGRTIDRLYEIKEQNQIAKLKAANNRNVD